MRARLDREYLIDEAEIRLRGRLFFTVLAVLCLRWPASGEPEVVRVIASGSLGDTYILLRSARRRDAVAQLKRGSSDRAADHLRSLPAARLERLALLPALSVA